MLKSLKTEGIAIILRPDRDGNPKLPLLILDTIFYLDDRYPPDEFPLVISTLTGAERLLFKCTKEIETNIPAIIYRYDSIIHLPNPLPGSHRLFE